MHDQTAYLENKLPSLPGECPTWRKQGGKCRLGVTCRFTDAHVAMTEEEIAREKVADDLLAYSERNMLTYDVRRQLRRDEYIFTRATAFNRALAAAEAKQTTNEEIPWVELEKPTGSTADAERKKVGVERR